VVGCDINREAVTLAHRCFPGASFLAARAEALPFASASFDTLYARSVITALDIPKALQEFNRVLKPGGQLWLTLFEWKDCRQILEGNWKRHRLKTVSLGIYILANSALLHHTGRLFRYPLNRSRMLSFQTESRFLRMLQNAGFSDIQFSHDRYFVAEAVKTKMSSPVVFLQAA
jgi:ubiquinone/menaquinone biosynthesis C-methylase UbiE